MASIKHYLLVGLGNYPSEYKHTKHNIGSLFIDFIATTEQSHWKTDTHFKVETSIINTDQYTLTLLKPMTYMNTCGQPINRFRTYFNIPIEHMIIASDSLDMPLYTAKYKASSRHGGHNGVRDILLHMGIQSVSQIRFGIEKEGRKGIIDGKNYVLSHFTKDELEALNSVFMRAYGIIKEHMKQ